MINLTDKKFFYTYLLKYKIFHMSRPILNLKYFIMLSLAILTSHFLIAQMPIRSFRKDSIPITYWKQPWLTDVGNSMLNIDIREVHDPYEKCDSLSVDYEGFFYYCGDIVGGIKNLLATPTLSIPHIRFLNLPQKKRRVYFYGFGQNMQWSKTLETTGNNSSIKDKSRLITTDGIQYIDARDIILKIMSQNFNFSVHLVEDSLVELSLRIVDYSKLFKAQISHEESQNGKYRYADTIQKPHFIIMRHNLQGFSYFIEQKINHYTYNDTNSLFTDFFHIELPTQLFINADDENILKIKNYLEDNYGLTLVSSKKLEKVYEIKFND